MNDAIDNNVDKPSLDTGHRRAEITSAPIAPTLFRLTLPMLFALVAIMSLGLVDSYFISFLGTNELAAIGFIVPITQLVTSVALGLGMAISSLNSVLVGAQQMNRAARLITDGFSITLICAIVMMSLLAWQLDNIFRLVGADQATLDHIHEYMHIWLFATPLLMLTQVCASTFRSIGDTRTSAVIAISMTLTNLILDPILIFGLGPIPSLGMQGAAFATLFAVMLSAAIGLYQLGIKERLLLLKPPSRRVFKRNTRRLFEIAVPAVLANAIVPLTAAVLITLVAQFGSDAVAGFGVGARVEAVSLLIVYALSSTLPMFIGQNLGARKPHRITQALRLTFKFVLILQLALYLILAISAAPIAALFSELDSVKEVIVWFLWILPASYGLSGIIILVNVSMNVLGKPKIALYINVFRLTLCYFPLAYLGAQLYGVRGLIGGVALGNVCAFVVAVALLLRVLREKEIIQ